MQARRVVERKPVHLFGLYRCHVANLLPCVRARLSDPHTLSVGALSQQAALRLIELHIP